MKSIKIRYSGMWSGFNPNNFFITEMLRRNYNVVFADNPDFLFYSYTNNEFLKFRHSIKIFFTYENIMPNFDFCDYALAYPRLSFGERYMRIPVFTWPRTIRPFTDKQLLNRKFCNFIYSNSTLGKGAKERIAFCKELSKYKHIDCPGKVLNNMPNALLPYQHKLGKKNKLQFLSDYKFTISYENELSSGYITEKLTDPLDAYSVPIYFGDPFVNLDFNDKAIINGNAYNSWEEVIDKIIYFDTHNDEYLAMVNEQPMAKNFILNDIEGFLINIIENGKIFDKQISLAFGSPHARHNGIIYDLRDYIIKPMLNNDQQKARFSGH